MSVARRSAVAPSSSASRSSATRRWSLGMLVSLSIAGSACHHWRSDGARRHADEQQLRAMMSGWWPALITRDTAYLAAVLAPDFVHLRSYHHEWEQGRKPFLELFRRAAPCGPGSAYQVKVDRYRVLGRHALVTQSVTTYVGEPSLSQSEVEVTHLFVKRDGRWQLLEGRYVWYQLPVQAWEPPDMTLPPFDAVHSTNPAERPRRMVTPCRPEWLQ